MYVQQPATMAAFSATALLLCAAALVAVATAAPPNQQLVAYDANRKQAIRFRCKEPQPRSVLSSKLTTVNTSERIDPPYTVLHRCDGASGCCASNSICDVLDSEQVTIVFAVTNSVRQDGKVEFREVTQTNHTRCHCVQMEPQLPK